MNCLYFLAPTLESTRQVADDLHAAGVDDRFLHVVSKDERGLAEQHIHSSNYLETLDIARDGLLGAALGLLVGILAVDLLAHFQPFGSDVPGVTYAMLLVLCVGFGAWEGGLAGIASENRKLRAFHRDIEAGRYLILVYARRDQEAAVKTMMHHRHPEARLVAVDKHFINPFASLRRRRQSSRAMRPLRKGRAW